MEGVKAKLGREHEQPNLIDGSGYSLDPRPTISRA